MPAAAQTDSATATAIRELIEASQVPTLFLRGMDQGLETQKAASPDMPEEFWSEFSNKARAEISDFVDMIVPVYARLLTREEIVQLTAFYRSPLGTRLTAIQGDLTVAMGQVGERWGVMLASEVMLDLAKRGIIVR